MADVLQIRNIFLRLNLEQTQHVLDGIVAIRKDIDIDSVPTYDSEMNNVIEQLESQGVFVQLPKEEEVIDDLSEKQQAQVVLAELYSLAMTVPTELKQPLFNKIQEMEQLLFG